MGYRKGMTTGYPFGDDKYVCFVDSTVTKTEYRFRELNK